MGLTIYLFKFKKRIRRYFGKKEMYLFYSNILAFYLLMKDNLKMNI